jgi:hypothetical protein
MKKAIMKPMRSRAWIFVFVFLVLGWLSVAVTRQQLIAAHVERSLGINRSGVFSGTVAPGQRTVRVPLIPLMLNPFQRHPRVYLMQGDFPVAEVQD